MTRQDGEGEVVKVTREHNTRQAAKIRQDPYGHLRAQMKKNRHALNTRSQTALVKAIQEVDGMTPKQARKMAREMAEGEIAPASAGGSLILQSDRPTFSEAFRTQFWQTHNGAPCKKCRKPVTQATGDIDHRESWGRIKNGIPEVMVCKNHVHWMVRFLDEARELYESLGNLQPMHKGCNRSKGGQRGTDSLIPQKKQRDLCPGKKCTLLKAT
jgi:hypothetical protein